MTSQLTIPATALEDVDWDERAVLGTYPLDGDTPARASIGHSEAVLLRPDTPGVEPDLAHRLAQEAATAYLLLRLVCSFRPDGAPITKATLAVRLSSAGGEAVVWSMSPERLATPVKHSRTVSLGPTVNLLGSSLEAVQVGRTREYEASEPYLTAAGAGEPTAEWYFTRTAAVDLSGQHDLTLVGRAPAGQQVCVDIGLQAQVRHLKTFRGRLPASQRQLLLDV